MLTKYRNYDEQLVRETMLGANALLLTEELTQHMELAPGMTVLDLGCGHGLSSYFLAREYGVTVYAVDPEVYSADINERMRKLSVSNLVTAFCANSYEMPFREGTFDAVVGINSWQNFGPNHSYLREYLLPLLKPQAQVGIAVPGMSQAAYDAMDERTRVIMDVDVIPTMFPKNRWRELWSDTPEFAVTYCEEMECTQQAWCDWLRASNPMAQDDETLRSRVDAKMAFVAMVGRRTA